jgi:hypothetical protein
VTVARTIPAAEHVGVLTREQPTGKNRVSSKGAAMDFIGSLFATRSAVLALALLGGTASLAASPEAGFLAENRAAMKKMMAAMDVKPSGDVDVDFVATMVPHHQGAIDMAQAQLRYGRNEQLRRIAQEIIVTQQQEIAAMRLAIAAQQHQEP